MDARTRLSSLPCRTVGRSASSGIGLEWNFWSALEGWRRRWPKLAFPASPGRVKRPARLGRIVYARDGVESELSASSRASTLPVAVSPRPLNGALSWHVGP